MKLGVNVDHVATLRRARGTAYPAPVIAALMSEAAGCDSIVAHLREDRRHVIEKDIFLIQASLTVPFNLEMSTSKKIVDFALSTRPAKATLVPEKREELTTEGGIDLIKFKTKVKSVVKKLQGEGVEVSLFIDPDKRQIDLAGETGAECIELNTGLYSESKSLSAKNKQLEKLKFAADYAARGNFFVAAGHGLGYDNVKEVAEIKDIEELNIGHAVISRAVFTGMVPAVKEMMDIIK